MSFYVPSWFTCNVVIMFVQVKTQCKRVYDTARTQCTERTGPNYSPSTVYPMAGAVLGTCLGGPVGLLAGVKIGGLAAIGGSIFGKFWFFLVLLSKTSSIFKEYYFYSYNSNLNLIALRTASWILNSKFHWSFYKLLNLIL